MDCELDPDGKTLVVQSDGYDDHGCGHGHCHDVGGNDCCH